MKKYFEQLKTWVQRFFTKVGEPQYIASACALVTTEIKQNNVQSQEAFMYSFIINLPHAALPGSWFPRATIHYHGYNMKNRSGRTVFWEACLGKRLFPRKHGANIGQKDALCVRLAWSEAKDSKCVQVVSCKCVRYCCVRNGLSGNPCLLLYA